jgi:hypothetical protein
VLFALALDADTDVHLHLRKLFDIWLGLIELGGSHWRGGRHPVCQPAIVQHTASWSNGT